MPFLTNYFNVDQLGYAPLLVLVLLGTVAMIYGSNCILRGASSIARLCKISEFAIGVTIVAVSTSLPELFVSIDAAVKGLGVISLANVVGSNIFNISLIFMLLCFFSHKTFMITKQSVIFLNVLNMCMLMLSLMIVSIIPKWIGGGFVAMLFLYFYWELTHPLQVVSSATHAHAAPHNTTRNAPQDNHIRVFIGSLFLFVLGVILLNFGAEYFLESAKTLGVRIGMSDKVIGILFIALGTSLPELVITVSAVFQILFRDKNNEETKVYIQDLASGNLIGSNIINILGVLGFSILIRPVDGIHNLLIDIVFMISSCIILILLLCKNLFLQKCIAIFQLIVLGSYVVYLIYLN